MRQVLTCEFKAVEIYRPNNRKEVLTYGIF